MWEGSGMVKGLIAIVMFTMAIAMPLCTVSVASGEVRELNVPEEVLQGREVTISGEAAPYEAVWLSSSFTLSLPVTEGGRYSREFNGIFFPEGDKRVTVRIDKIKDMKIEISGIELVCDENNVSVIKRIWGIPITVMKMPSVINEGVGTLSLSLPVEVQVPGVPEPMPMDLEGEHDVKISGNAEDDTAVVRLRFTMALKVTADSTGAFHEALSTEGVPTGEFIIAADGIEKRLRIVSALTPTTPSPTPTPSPAPTSTPAPTLTPTPAPTLTPVLTPPPPPPPASVPVPFPVPSPSSMPASTPAPAPAPPTPDTSPAVSPSPPGAAATASPRLSVHGFHFAILGLLLAAAGVILSGLWTRRRG